MPNGPRSRIVIEGLRAAFLLLLLAALPLAAAYLVGTRLPEDHTATASGIIQASPPRVWELITDFATQENWRTGPLTFLRRPMRLGTTEPCRMEGWPLLKMAVCTTDAQINRSQTVKTIGTSIPFDATWTFDLSPSDPSNMTTKLTITQHASIDPPLWRFIGRYILRQNTGVRQYLTDIKAEALRHP